MNLSITVTPGKIFYPGELVTESKLNLLGIPTIQVNGMSALAATVTGQPCVWDSVNAYWRPADTSTYRIGGTYLGTMLGCSPSAAGAGGAVPEPSAGDVTRYLSAQGTWQALPNPSETVGGNLYLLNNLY